MGSFEDVDIPNPRQQLTVSIDQMYRGVNWARGNVSIFDYILTSLAFILIVDVVSVVLSEGDLSTFIVALAVGAVFLTIAILFEIFWRFRKCASCERVVPAKYRRVGGFPQSRICFVCSEALNNSKVENEAKAALEANWENWKRRKLLRASDDEMPDTVCD